MTKPKLGYLLEEHISDIDEFVTHCRTVVVAGGGVFDPLVTEQLINRRSDRSALDELSVREYEVLELMAAGASNRAISAALICSGKTVESHVRSIFRKLGLAEHPDENRRVTAVLRWLSVAK